MNQFSGLTRIEIAQGLSAQEFNISRIICLAMLAGALMFLFVILIFYQINLERTVEIPADYELDVMIYLFLFLSVVGYYVFIILPNFFLKPANLRKRLAQLPDQQPGQTMESSLRLLISLDRVFMVIRLAVLDAISIFGLVILFLAVIDGTVYEDSRWWLLTLPLLIQAGITFRFYVSREQMVSRLEKMARLLSGSAVG
jgi:hypothetical protein